MNLLDANDEAGKYPRSWYANSTVGVVQHPKLEREIRVEVCVIGAGYSGLSAAYHLNKSGRNVAIVEAQRVGWGASGRNGGQLGSGQRLDQVELETLVGRPAAKTLWQLAQQSKALVKNLISENHIECDIKPGIIYVNHRARFNAHSQAEVQLLNDEYAYEAIRYVAREECRQLVGSTSYHGGTLDWDAAHLHPLNYALGLANAVKKAGVQIFENSRVLSVEEGQPVTIITQHGRIIADELIFACNGYMGKLASAVSARVMPINNFLIATQPLSKQLAHSVLSQDIAVADSKFVVNYFRLSKDRRMLFGGRESYGYRFPKDIQNFVRKPMVQIFPQLRDVKIDYGWGGTLAITMSRMPHFAHLAPNIKSISGYSGHGVGMATLAGKLVSEAINGEDSGFAAFQSIASKKFPGGPSMRTPLLVLAMLYHSMLDKI